MFTLSFTDGYNNYYIILENDLITQNKWYISIHMLKHLSWKVLLTDHSLLFGL